MGFKRILLALILKIICAENRMLPEQVVTMTPLYEDILSATDNQNEESPRAKVIGLNSYKIEKSEDEEKEIDEYSYEIERRRVAGPTKKPCAIVVLSNIQNPSMQSLLRKYRYDANGILIPSSVQYFIKLPQGLRAAPLLVPLNDKAFSPLGGFVRYYKEFPPIPQSWKR